MTAELFVVIVLAIVVIVMLVKPDFDSYKYI